MDTIFNVNGLKMKPLSVDLIRNQTHSLIDLFEIKGDKIPIVRVLEHFIYIIKGTLEISPDYELDEEGKTYPDEKHIQIKESVYIRACNDDGQARFTLAHELGHLILHQNQASSFARKSTSTKHKPYEDSEWQANTFAAELLADSRKISATDTPEDLMTRFGITRMAASIRLKKIFQGKPTES